MKRILINCALLGVAFIVSIAAGEAIIRLFVPQELWVYRDSTEDWAVDPVTGIVQKPNLDVSTHVKGETIRFQTNLDGLRPHTAKAEKSPDKIRIMLFGDSTVAGRNVPESGALHAQLERELRNRGHQVEVINAGVEGFDSGQTMLRMQQLIPRYMPDIVSYGGCDNDYSAVTRSDEKMPFPKPRFTLGANGQLVEEAPDVEKGIVRYGSGFRLWIQSSALYRYFQPFIVLMRSRLMNWEERNMLGLAGEVYYNKKSLDSLPWDVISALVAKMKALADEHDVIFFTYNHPALAEVWQPYIDSTLEKLGANAADYNRYALEEKLSKLSAEHSVPHCRLIDSFTAAAPRGPFHLLPRDPHCNASGYQVQAETIADFLEAQYFLSSENGENN